ncbi:MAG: glycosyltransferase [Bacteroides sp.]|nr:glycosyltransferase [Bacteroides sp.]
MKHYFITTEEDTNTSAIELAQVKRMKIFDSLGEKSMILETKYNYFHAEAQTKLKTEGRVINIYQYFQQLQRTKEDNPKLLDSILDKKRYKINKNIAIKDNKTRIMVSIFEKRIYTVSYYDSYGFLDKKDYYDHGVLSYQEFFADDGRLIMKQYLDNNGLPIILFHYRGSNENKPVLCLIELKYNGHNYNFDSEAEFIGFFLDILSSKDDIALYSDRAAVGLEAFKYMKTKAKRYVVFHSHFRSADGQIFYQYRLLEKLMKQRKVDGLISSTEKESNDLKLAFNTSKSYYLPVTYVDESKTHIKFNQRKPYSLIAIARLDAVKQLDHIIKAAINLHKKFPKLTLDFYGMNTTSADNTTYSHLQEMVIKNNAETFIHFNGFRYRIDSIYKNSWIEILTSKYEGFAMSVLEAQSFGCPVVSYDIDYGPNEIVQNQVSGELVKANDQKALQNTLEKLLTNPNILEKYSSNSFIVANKFNFINVRNKWKNFLQKE